MLKLEIDREELVLVHMLLTNKIEWIRYLDQQQEMLLSQEDL